MSGCILKRVLDDLGKGNGTLLKPSTSGDLVLCRFDNFCYFCCGSLYNSKFIQFKDCFDFDNSHIYTFTTMNAWFYLKKYIFIFFLNFTSFRLS